MRILTAHAINPCNEAIQVAALDQPGPGGASHRYGIRFDKRHPDDAAERAYAAYAKSTGGKNFQGNPMPAWIDLPTSIQLAWIAATCDVLNTAAANPDIAFQNGPVKENGEGVNGVTHEALLAVLIDRLEGFQAGPYACPENARAILLLQDAMATLHTRTMKREARGVEGTHLV